MSNSYVEQVNNSTRRLWSKEKPQLTSIDFELTERCNNDCIHCCINRPAGDKDARWKELKTGQWLKLLEEAAEVGAMNVRFTGGEPLLRPDFLELYIHARKLGLRVTLFTNGCLITPEIADVLAAVPPRNNIEITIYGMTERSYAAVSRRKSSYAMMRRGLRLLDDRAIPYVVKGTVLPPNRHEAGELRNWALTLPGMKSEPPGFVVFLEYRSRRDDYGRNRQIEALRLSPQEGVRFLASEPQRFIDEKRAYFKRFYDIPDDRVFTCGTGTTLCVDPYGMLQFCPTLRHPQTIADVRKTSIRSYLLEWLPKLYEIRASNDAFRTRCARCAIRTLCELCPGRSWSEHGELDKPVEYFCEAAHEEAKYIGLLETGEHGWIVEDIERRLRALPTAE